MKIWNEKDKLIIIILIEIDLHKSKNEYLLVIYLQKSASLTAENGFPKDTYIPLQSVPAL